jgi:predicted permease
MRLVPDALALLLDVVAPVFLVILVGGVVGRRFALEVRHVNRLALYAAVPALAFRTLANLELAAGEAGRLLAAYALYLALAAALAALVGARWPGPARRALVGTSLLGNAANLNLPVALFAFGPAGLDRALILFVATSLAMYTVGPALLGRAAGPGRALRTVATFPVAWAVVAGAAVNVASATLPLPIERAVDLLADAAIPMVLLALGVQLAATGRFRPGGRAWTGVGLKLVAGPALAAGAGLALGLTGLDLAVLVLMGAMPTAVNAAMLAIEFGGEARQVSDTVVAATALSLVALPLLLTVLVRLP